MSRHLPRRRRHGVVIAGEPVRLVNLRASSRSGGNTLSFQTLFEHIGSCNSVRVSLFIFCCCWLITLVQDFWTKKAGLQSWIVYASSQNNQMLATSSDTVAVHTKWCRLAEQLQIRGQESRQQLHRLVSLTLATPYYSQLWWVQTKKSLIYGLLGSVSRAQKLLE